QGDEPVINPEDIEEIIKNINFSNEVILNGYTTIQNEQEYISLSTPKVVFAESGKLLYMSRSPIPGNKIGDFNKAWRQVCIYAFPYRALEKFSSVQKTPLEEEEDIEILRFLELGYEVKMIEMSSQSIPVDIEEDLIKVKNYLQNNP